MCSNSFCILSIFCQEFFTKHYSAQLWHLPFIERGYKIEVKKFSFELMWLRMKIY